ncbi:enoyl-CoA hydratase family protein [Nocardioides daejeonensis]|uniref:enoyl-CoA hydratase family protein n=1 Tax=Nocardioides daejeonensis TaxID=1046556 RepID=UPI0030840AEB
MTELVKYDVAASVATLTFDSPHNRNALSRQLVTEFYAGLDRAEADAEVKVVLVRAAGRTFCSGADLSEASEGGMEEGALGIVELQRRIVAFPKPVVTRLHGAVRAGGIGIIASSDVCISTVDATFALTEVKLGLAPAAISLTVVPRMTSRAAAWAALTGEVFTGAAAEQMGLVTKAVPESELDEAVAQVCQALASGSPQGLRETKALLAEPLLSNIDDNGAELAKLSARLFGSDEARDAMLAFLSRKKG